MTDLDDLKGSTDGVEDQTPTSLKPSEEDISKVDEGAKNSIARQDTVDALREEGLVKVDDLKGQLLGRESKENQTIGPIYMVFRENNNWDKYAPKIIEHIQSLGGETEVKTFPRGTKDVDIFRWYLKNKDTFQGKFLLTDTTCTPRALGEDKFIMNVNLDNFLAGAKSKIVSGILEKEGISYNDMLSKIFEIIFKRNMPQKVTLVRKCFSHHYGLKGYPRYESGEEESITKERDAAIAEFLKKSLIDAGYPEEKILVTDDIEDRELSEEEVKEFEKEWFFIDGHNRKERYSKNGLTIVEPSDVYKLELTDPSKEDLTDDLTFEVGSCFKKIESANDFVSLFYNKEGGYFSLPSSKIFAHQINSGEEWLTIVKHLNDLIYKNKLKISEYKQDSFISGCQRLTKDLKKSMKIDEQQESEIKTILDNLWQNRENRAYVKPI